MSIIIVPGRTNPKYLLKKIGFNTSKYISCVISTVDDDLEVYSNEFGLEVFNPNELPLKYFSDSLSDEYLTGYLELTKDIRDDFLSILILMRQLVRGPYSSVFNNTIDLDRIIWNCFIILEKFKPNALLYHNTPHGLDWFLAKSAEFLGIKVYIFRQAPIFGLYWLVEGFIDQKRCSGWLNDFQLSPKGDFNKKTIKYIESVSGDYNTAIPSYMKNREKALNGQFISFKAEFIKLIKNLHSFNKFGKQIVRTFHNYSMLNYYEKLSRLNVDSNEKIILIFLHYQPERSTLPEGGVFVDQFHMVKLLSLFAPKGWSVIVREHPSTFRVGCHPHWRVKSFYDSISNLGNVELISMNVDPFDLIDRSELVATVTGTVGFESIIRKKPVLLFGEGSYKDAPGVYIIRNSTDLASSIRRILLNNNKIDFKDIVDYVHGVYLDSIHELDKEECGFSLALKSVYNREVVN
jgi:hypothetical protein